MQERNKNIPAFPRVHELTPETVCAALRQGAEFVAGPGAGLTRRGGFRVGTSLGCSYRPTRGPAVARAQTTCNGSRGRCAEFRSALQQILTHSIDGLLAIP